MKDMQEILKRARDTYGSKNQILVCIEELNELACVLAKYPRYEDEKRARGELTDKVIDEVADVTIILNHVKAIFDINEERLNDRIEKKISRVERWLSNSQSMQQTIDDRTVQSFCSGCSREGTHDGSVYNSYCVHCFKAQATEGIAPFNDQKGNKN